MHDWRQRIINAPPDRTYNPRFELTLDDLKPGAPTVIYAASMNGHASQPNISGHQVRSKSQNPKARGMTLVREIAQPGMPTVHIIRPYYIRQAALQIRAR